jgi:aminopeptidase
MDSHMVKQKAGLSPLLTIVEMPIIISQNEKVKGNKMTDARVKKLAYVLLHYSVDLKKKQVIRLNSNVLAMPLIKELYAEAIAMGAYPITRIGNDELDEIFLKNANDDQLSYVSPMSRLEVETMDAMVGIWASTNTKYLSGVTPQKQALSRKAQAKIIKRFSERAAKGQLKWVGTLFPTQAAAQDAGMSLADYEDFVYGAGLIDKKDPIAEWRKASKYNQRLVNYLKGKKTLRITAPDTDLTLKVGGRKWINCDGKNNFPDGEVFTSPIENSANGRIRYTFPAIYGGREVEDIRLEFKEGKVVKATALKGQDFLDAMLNMDKGARYIGEVAIGTNFGIKRFTKNILFDEKIGGTCHLAVGEAFPESGGKNFSSLHWDMICDLRSGGCLYADGQLFFKNGKFLK